MANIQKLWTSYVDLGSDGDQTTPYDYIGQEGRLWYDNVTNAIRVSDGNTPGGTIVGGGGGGGAPGSPNASVQFNNQNNFGGDANFTFNAGTNTLTVDYIISNITSNTFISNTANLGNFTISDQTLAGTITDRDVTIATVGNANVEILGGFHIHTDSNVSNTAQFTVANGEVLMLVPNVGLQGAVNIVGSVDGTEVAPQNNGVMLHVTGQPSIPSRVYNDGVNAYGVLINRRYNGTSSAPTGVLANQIIGRMGATPYLSTDEWPAISTTRIDFLSTEDQTDSGQGSQIQMWATNDGETTPLIVAQFDPGTVLLTGNLLPNSTTSQYSLGNATNKWGNLYLGPASLWIEDTTLGTNAELTVNNGALLINGAQKIEIGNMQMTSNGISHTANATSQDLTIGTVGATGYTSILNAGLKFTDGSTQNTAAIPLTQRANAGGVATLGLDGIVPASQLPAGGISYQGTWNATTNTPTLADGTGSAGDQYLVAVGGTINLGSGSITFSVGDGVLYNGTIWQRVPSVGGVTSFNTRTGAVTLQSSDVTTALSSGSITNAKLANSNIVVTTGFGLSGGATIDLGGTLTLTTNVGNILGGTGVGVSSSSGNYTISIGQPVGTANSVQFLAVAATTTIQATGNVTGGNITTAGQVVATGNITTSGYLKTANTTINSGITSNGTINFTASSNVALGSNANVHITGGTSGYLLATNGSGNLSWVNYGTPGQSLYLGVFYSTVTQTNSIANVARAMTYDTSESYNNGVSIVTNSRITIANAGIYNIQFSVQIDKTDAGTDDIDIWLSRNGANEPNTNTQLTLQNQSAKQVASWNFVVQAAAGDYFEIYWSSADTGMRLLSTGTQTTPTRPATPSVILTVTQA